MTRGVLDAPSNVVRQVENAAQALDVSMRAAGAKCAYVGACIGKSANYVSKLRTGSRPIPDKLVKPLCLATGSNLLKQWIDWQAALTDDPKAHTARLASLLSAAA